MCTCKIRIIRALSDEYLKHKEEADSMPDIYSELWARTEAKIEAIVEAIKIITDLEVDPPCK